MVKYMLPSGSVQVREYLDVRGRSPFRKWLNALDSVARVKVVTAVARLEHGNFSNVRHVGKGVLERKVNYGPGLRIYFAHEGNRLVLLLGGSTKRRQTAAIIIAQRALLEFKRRKMSGEESLWH